jgi:hypothetical protein
MNSSRTDLCFCVRLLYCSATASGTSYTAYFVRILRRDGSCGVSGTLSFDFSVVSVLAASGTSSLVVWDIVDSIVDSSVGSSVADSSAASSCGFFEYCMGGSSVSTGSSRPRSIRRLRIASPYCSRMRSRYISAQSSSDAMSSLDRSGLRAIASKTSNCISENWA